MHVAFGWQVGKRALVDVHLTQVPRPTDRTQTRIRSHLIDTGAWGEVDTADDAMGHSNTILPSFWQGRLEHGLISV